MKNSNIVNKRKRQSIIVADISGVESEGKILGHMPQVAKDYYGALSPYADVEIAGQIAYNKYFLNENLLVLPYACKSTDKRKIIKKYHEFLNAKKTLKYNKDIVIFQSYARNTVLYLALLLTKSKSKVYMIQYYAMGKGHLGRFGRVIEEILFSLVKARINGVICSMDMVGKSYNLPYYKITDYIYSDYSRKDYAVTANSYDYDFGIVGLMGPGKGLDEILYSFKNTKYKVIIAGSFLSNDYYKKIVSQKSENITVINRYLTDGEYNDLINSIQYIVMPYINRNAEHSSGTILDAIFRKKPVVCSNHPAFEIVSEYDLGFVFKEHISECFDRLKPVDCYRKNIDRFIDSYNERVKGLLDFMNQN